MPRGYPETDAPIPQCSGFLLGGIDSRVVPANPGSTAADVLSHWSRTVSLVDLRATVGHDSDGVIVLSLRGEVDIESAPLINRLVDSTIGEGEPRVVIDLSEVTFLDSRGIRALLRAHRSAVQRGSQLIVRSPSKPALEVLVITGCDEVLNLT